MSEVVEGLTEAEAEPMMSSGCALLGGFDWSTGERRDCRVQLGTEKSRGTEYGVRIS